MSKHTGTAFFRITVLGQSKCGKTSLINAWVNNFCPTVHTATDHPTLYYKAVSIPEGGDDEAGDTFDVIVEIEDSYGADRGDGMVYNDQGRPQPRNVADFLSMTRQAPWANASANTRKAYELDKLEKTAPLSVYDPPKVNKYKPLTKGRMGYMFVFDANDEQSYLAACKLHEDLVDELQKKKEHLSPAKVLVANKCDENPTNPKYIDIIDNANTYSEEHMMKFRKVSARDFALGHGIEKLFMDMINDVKGNQILWMLDEKTSGGQASAGDAAGECSLQ